MTGDQAPQGQPLRPADPRQLGRYRLLGRLGQGGMGTVYLAEPDSGGVVAIKVIRGDLTDDPEFRRRFRSEVARAREVPPFCTAEVLDADPDHNPPYLVVEYVNGPSLDDVVRSRGPLTPGNLHGLAIGVATALTAIHGVGVIHRDLKPTNVLLAPGSPKVIDFGIARTAHATAAQTSTDRLMGTVAYMAPERFDGAAAKALTAAADIFAWGAVVAYAGTGHTPFAADSAPATAFRIMTQPPDLDGLTGPLRHLVEQALAKDPADRPTARELLDRLLALGPARPFDLAATAAMPTVPAVGSAAPASGQAGPAGPAEPARPARPAGSAEPAGLAGPAARGRRRLALIGTALVTGAVLLGAGIAAGVIRLPAGLVTNPGERISPSPTVATVAPPAAAPFAAGLMVRDPLTEPGLWQPRYDPDHKTTCTFVQGLVVTRQTAGVYRCPGPLDTLTDFALFVDVTLHAPGNCAGIWFRFTVATGGYALRVCEDAYYLVRHDASVTTLRTMRFTNRLPLGVATRVGITAEGANLRFTRDGEQVGRASPADYAQGRTALGIFQTASTDPPPFRVSFANIEIWAVGA